MYTKSSSSSCRVIVAAVILRRVVLVLSCTVNHVTEQLSACALIVRQSNVPDAQDYSGLFAVLKAESNIEKFLTGRQSEKDIFLKSSWKIVLPLGEGT
ncbi:hypothetical protein X777_01257 [Ooceraea biroi]|uniref:Uncharacterized protein n=1 Tax=Ooceraea biroi TaxID=2015173 RepID=A0A026WQJ9_OOCBI|nr:hypothetical protein X777_01257 [Ooceraea biroi]